MGDFINSLATVDPIWMYVGIFFVAYIENIFPPAPSDIAVVLGGALAALERGHFLFALFAGVLGSTLGFMTMYSIGVWFGSRVLETGQLKFIQPDSIQRMDAWFRKYGYWLIVANRFLAGTRSVVSFFAGISKLDFKTTAIFSFISSMLWYGILVYVGYSLGNHWEDFREHLAVYSETVIAATMGVLIILIGRYFFKRCKTRKVNA